MLDIYAMIQIEIDYFLRAKKSDILYSMRFCRSAGARPSNLDFLKMLETKTAAIIFIVLFLSSLAFARRKVRHQTEICSLPSLFSPKYATILLSCLYSHGGISMDKRKIDMVSLFCGAGGLDKGFENKGFRTVWANDFDGDVCETHRGWSSAEVVHGDIGKVDFKSIPRTEVIAGGFPCQGFSLAGPRKLDDSRNVLYRYFVKLVEEKQPKVFVV